MNIKNGYKILSLAAVMVLLAAGCGRNTTITGNTSGSGYTNPTSNSFGNEGGSGSSPSSGSGQSVPPAAVPAAYQSLYSGMQDNLTHYQSEISSNPAKYPVNYSVNLIYANSNAGTTVYANCPTPSEGSNCQVDKELDGIQALGAKAVMVTISYPIFDQGFFTNIGMPASTAQNFINYYVALGNDIRNRGLKMIVEANPLLTTQGYGSHPLDPTNYYKTMTWQQYVQLRSKQNLIVAQQVKPDYLILQSEPTSDAKDNSVFTSDLGNPTTDAAMVQQFVTDLNNAGINHSTTELGAGVLIGPSSWQGYISAFTKISGLDSIDAHIYYVGDYQKSDPVSIASQIYSMAKAAGKKVSMAEFWPHMSTTPQGANVTSTSLKAVDSYSFWDPLYDQYFQTMMKFANQEDLDYFSPFDDSQFFANVDYSSAPCQLAYPATSSDTSCITQINSLESQSTSKALNSNPIQLSPLGQDYKTDITNFSN